MTGEGIKTSISIGPELFNKSIAHRLILSFFALVLNKKGLAANAKG